jgi:nitrate reductase gamma subunit
MYQFLTGPLAWLSFAIFSVGLIVRTVLYIRGFNWKFDRFTDKENATYGIKGVLGPTFLWLFPLGDRRWRNNIGIAILVFVFRIGLVVMPIFLLAHNIILKERWGIRFWTLPETTADILTIAVIFSAVFLILRCVALPRLRNITTVYDYVLLAILLAPLITGFLAYHQVPTYRFWLIAHIICGEIMLIAIPFAKIWHVV